jgi:hypothetical protein
MKRYFNVLVGIGVLAFAAVATFAAAHAYWRPAMPALVVDLKAKPREALPPSLLLIYGDRGSDPLRSGTLAPDDHLSDCSLPLSHDAGRATCVSRSARREFHSVGTQRQSLQIRALNGHGNPIIGGLAWDGPAFPSAVKVQCDLSIADPGRSCTLADKP